MITALLLAAGTSRRFGPECKLQAPYRGQPLIRHAAEAILATGLPRVAVVADPAVARLLPEFRIVWTKGPQSASLRAGIQAVTGESVLVVLGDMPHVGAALLRALAAAPPPAAAVAEGPPGPPAHLPRALFPALLALTGDRGAGPLLRALPGLARIRTTADTLRDIDTPGDMA
ncbi:NTP transferase domain-containing protein [Paenirhodobacter sp.]|uniref:NTP transferase domain-containing protein n=1 Tax=Paenirhodobacter sp. TaxID=1965326 RepID=UPI003B421D1D